VHVPNADGGKAIDDEPRWEAALPEGTQSRALITLGTDDPGGTAENTLRPAADLRMLRALQKGSRRAGWRPS
jgi:hypothetical protein